MEKSLGLNELKCEVPRIVHPPQLNTVKVFSVIVIVSSNIEYVVVVEFYVDCTLIQLLYVGTCMC